MKIALMTLLSLATAAALESGGDAAIRKGLDDRASRYLALGACVLALYGFVVNFNRLLDFSALMGGYIAVFFVVSQLIAVFALGDRPAPTTLLGGALIVIGGAIVQWGALRGAAA
jgi:drug/metabolite transporter superfamily protein YnfA